MTVVDNYEFDFPVIVAFVIECFVVMWQIAYFSRVKILRSFKKMIVSFVCAAICLAMGICYGAYMRTDDVLDRFALYPYLFTPNTVYTRDGMMVSLLFSLKFMGVEKPDGYSEDAVAALAKEYANDSAADTGTKPNIIVIMNEAWSDITAIAPFETNEEVFPVTSKLKENVIRGNMYMSVNGGNTANSEFEFLTGSSMAFLPPGSVPYQLFLKHETPTLVASLEEQGYQTAAMHPYHAAGWDRNKVYDYFGFDEMYFDDSFPKDAERIRSYISDRAMFEKIEEVYEQRDESKPFFLFGVTMQNHGGYTGHFDNFEQSVTVKGLESRASLSQYLSLIRETDFAFGDLMEYFSNVDEPTIILMFGDHQPGEFVTSPLYANAGLTYPPKSFEDQQDKFIVPFIMWANYDVEEKDDVLTSPNYLSNLVCETAGLKLTPYQIFLSKLSEECPVITANFYIDANGAFHMNDEMKSVDLLNKYKIIQYNQIIDYKNRAAEMYTTLDKRGQ
jgi:phosphoglycerol transferase MdoB-like AlkP superfamily enzyme